MHINLWWTGGRTQPLRKIVEFLLPSPFWEKRGAFSTNGFRVLLKPLRYVSTVLNGSMPWVMDRASSCPQFIRSFHRLQLPWNNWKISIQIQMCVWTTDASSYKLTDISLTLSINNSKRSTGLFCPVSNTFLNSVCWKFFLLNGHISFWSEIYQILPQAFYFFSMNDVDYM